MTSSSHSITQIQKVQPKAAASNFKQLQARCQHSMLLRQCQIDIWGQVDYADYESIINAIRMSWWFGIDALNARFPVRLNAKFFQMPLKTWYNLNGIRIIFHCQNLRLNQTFEYNFYMPSLFNGIRTIQNLAQIRATVADQLQSVPSSSK